MNAELPLQDLKERTRKFALGVIKLYSALPKTTVAQVIGHQMLRSGTSVGAQYHEGARSRSPAEYVSKLESALQELEETRYWIMLLIDSEIMTPNRLTPIQHEAEELTAILFTCARKAKQSIRAKVAK